MSTSEWDVIIVGGGPAGLAAAQMLGRARRRTLVLDAGRCRNRFAEHMHGVVGFDGAAPADLRARGRDEARAYGVEFRDAEVEAVRDLGAGLEVRAAGALLRSRSLVVASGVTDVLPDVPGLAERWGASVLHCPYCHGDEVRGQRLGVLVTSELGLHQAQLVRQWSERVTVFAGGARDARGERVVPPVELSEAIAARLHARGVEVITEAAVTGLRGADGALAAVTLDDGEVEIDALFTAGTFAPHDEFLAPLALARDDSVFGSLLRVDGVGQTSHPRVWAVGNVVAPNANVPVALGAGSMTGALVNWALAEEDADRAVAAAFWETKYHDTPRVWSGRVNPVLADIAGELPAGRALDLGCGEGGDALWLAARGWRVTGIDVAPTAIARAREAAREAGAESARFVAADALAALTGELAAAEFDLVTASFFQSPVTLDRVAALRAAAARIRPGGRLLVTSHAEPPLVHVEPAHAGPSHFFSPEEELRALALDEGAWEVELAEVRRRKAMLRDGQAATMADTVVLLRRRSSPAGEGR